MKILHISKYYYPFVGGVEQVARDCVLALNDDAEQHIICFNHEKGDKTDEVDGVKVTRCGCFAKISSQSLSFSYKKLLKKKFAEFEPDVVIFHFPNPFAAHYLLKLLKKRKNCKLIVYYHLDITKQKILGKLFKGQTKKLLNRADKIIATSPNYIKGSPFLQNYETKCTLIPNCVSAERVNAGDAEMEAAREIRQKNEGKIILFAVGRHVPYKGMEYLIRASRFLDERFKIYIGGEGALTESLKKLAAGDEKIEFTGGVNDGVLKAYYLACDIFCFPSITKNEAFGLSLAEALSFGKPAVTFTIEGSGVNYVNLKDVTGLEVENGNVEKYAEAIEKLASNRNMREDMGKAAKERAEELFSSETFGENVRRAVCSVCGVNG